MEVAVRPVPAQAGEPADLAALAPVPLERIRPDGTIAWSNAAHAQLLGYAAGELVGQRIQDLHVDRPTAPHLLERLARGEGVRELNARLRGKDGAIRVVTIDAVPLQEKGRWVGGLLATRDLTLRSMVEAERTGMLTQALATPMATGEAIASLTDGFLLMGPDWTVQQAQLTAGAQHASRLIGRKLWDVYPEVEGTPFEQFYRDAMSKRKPASMTAYYAPMNMWLHNQLIPIGDGLLLVYRDLSGQRELQQQFIDRNAQMAVVARLGADALRGRRFDDLLEDAVEALCSTLHVEIAKVLHVLPDGAFHLIAGRGLPKERLGETLSGSVVAQARYALSTNQPVLVPDLASETRFPRPPLLLEAGVVSGMSVVIPGPAGPYGVLGAHSTRPRAFTPDDLHFLENMANLLATALERDRAEAELRAHRADLERLVARRTAALERANRELEAFNYSVSHDLRAPLRAIGGFAGLLARRHADQLDEKATDLLAQVQAAVTRMGRLIDDMLGLARLQRADLHRQEVDVSAMARRIADRLGAGRRGLAVQVEPGLRAVGDPALVEIALENLLGNAVKFTQQRSDAKVVVRGVATRDGPGFEVEDNGAGFESAFAGKLFEPFQRLHSDAEFAGTGIGLATVRRIVERHGGRVWARGEPGKGATFGFTLPPDATEGSAPMAGP